MIRIGLFCIFFPFAVMEVLFYHHFGLVIVGSLYIGLTLQAERAASKHLKNMAAENGKKRRHWSEDDAPIEEPEEIKVKPLGEKRQAPFVYTPPPPYEEPAAAPAAPVQTTRAGFTASSGSRTLRRKPLPPAPNFRGLAHEILGVDENAATRTIVNAFRHWIKRFHPDRAIGLPAEMAAARSQRITEAKELLLERRRAKKAA